MNNDTGEQIGSSIGRFTKADLPTDGVGWESSLRIRVELNIMNSLARGRTIIVNSQKMWIPIRYEKLPKICFRCGQISHEDQ